MGDIEPGQSCSHLERTTPDEVTSPKFHTLFESAPPRKSVVANFAKRLANQHAPILSS